MTELSAHLNEMPVIGIVRRCPPEHSAAVVGAAVAEGLRVAEVTFDSAEAGRQIANIREAFPGVVVGAGTVTSIDQLEDALSYGALFVVTPVLVEEVLGACAERGIVCLPGTATPTEMWRATRLGAPAVKVFPAAQLGGPDYLRALREPLEGLRLVPTGGVTVSNARAYLEAGAWAVGVGSALFSRSWMAEGNVRSITRAMAALREELR